MRERLPNGQPKIEYDDVLDVDEALTAKAVNEHRAQEAATKKGQQKGKRK